MNGTVSKIEFTHGGLGNQWTTINGVRYATWWDIRHLHPKEGDLVEHQPYQAPAWGDATVQATRIVSVARQIGVVS